MNWFRPADLLFRPVSAGGCLISLAAIAFCVLVFIVALARSHSASDTFYGICPFWAPTWLGLSWIADRTGGRA